MEDHVPEVEAGFYDQMAKAFGIVGPVPILKEPMSILPGQIIDIPRGFRYQGPVIVERPLRLIPRKRIEAAANSARIQPYGC